MLSATKQQFSMHGLSHPALRSHIIQVCSSTACRLPGYGAATCLVGCRMQAAAIDICIFIVISEWPQHAASPGQCQVTPTQLRRGATPKIGGQPSRRSSQVAPLNSGKVCAPKQRRASERRPGPQACEGDGQALHIHRGRDGAVANVGSDVVAEWVAQMRAEVGQGALAGCLHRKVRPQRFVRAPP